MYWITHLCCWSTVAVATTHAFFLPSHTALGTVPWLRTDHPVVLRNSLDADNVVTIPNGGAQTPNADLTPERTIRDVYEAKTSSKFARYQQEYQASIRDVAAFWNQQALEYLVWDRPFDHVLQGSLEQGNVAWFTGGKLNTAYNAIDRHVQAGKGAQTAILWEGDEPHDVRAVTYDALLAKVAQIANALRAQGVGKGDVVTIYMPMIPELAMTMLACARIGAVHSVVFAGFSAEALAQRVVAADSAVIVTADQGARGGKSIPLKNIVNDALTKMNTNDVVDKVLVWERYFDHDALHPEETEPTYEMQPKDVRMDVLVAAQRPYCPPVSMDAEDNLFILYTSGSTGQPKGVVHTVGGYSLYAAFTTKNTFDLTDGDIFACVADCGWITGHTYVVYGALLNGSTTFMFESTPLYPDTGRYWDMVQRHRITQFYTAPTAIRSLMRYGEDIPHRYDLSSLKVLGSVGEPINPEAWRWYYEEVGRSRCTVVDTYWQTETGGHVISNLPGITPMKPGSCTVPLYGIDAVVLDAVDGHMLEPKDGESTEGVLAIRQPWPGMARTCLGDHERYQLVYTKPYPGYYFTGDSVMRDKDGFFFITGRVDDVLNVSGHRIGTAEVESALVLHPAVSQAAVVGKAHDVKGQGIVGFVTLDVNHEESPELLLELRNQVRSEIGPFAAPDKLYITPSLPMTRSGKIMRRILRKIVAGEVDTLGDTSTLADPSVVDDLIAQVQASEDKK
jgi:acetyl-CoA synthetase